MASKRQKIVAGIAKMYPFYSGCGSFANSKVVQTLAGPSDECEWARVTGGLVYAPLGDYVGRAAFYSGDLDRKITWICSKIVRDGDTVLDVGANIGIVTLALAKSVGTNGRVYSFEPNPEMVAYLNKTISYNKLDNVVLKAYALGKENGTMDLHVPCTNAGKASLMRKVTGDFTTVTVAVNTLSGFADAEDIGAIRLVKLDVEGFEKEVLYGGEKMFRDNRPDSILFELNEKSGLHFSDEPVIKVLSAYGYRFLSVPRCLLNMRLKVQGTENGEQVSGNDYLAVVENEWAAMKRALRVH